MHRLGHVDEAGRVAALHLPVELIDVGDADHPVEAEMVGEGLEHLVLRSRSGGHVGVLFVGSEKKHPFVVGDEVVDVDKTCRRGERTVVGIGRAVERVVDGVEVVEGAQQLYFVEEALLLEDFYHVAGELFAAHERDVGCCDLAQPGSDFIHEGFVGLYRISGFVEEPAVVPFRDGVLELEHESRGGLERRLIEHHA